MVSHGPGDEAAAALEELSSSPLGGSMVISSILLCLGVEWGC